MHQIVSASFPAPEAVYPAISPVIAAAIRRAMATDPSQRFESCDAFAEALRADAAPPAAAPVAVERGPEAAFVPERPASFPIRAVIVAGVALGALLAVVAGIVAWRGHLRAEREAELTARLDQARSMLRATNYKGARKELSELRDDLIADHDASDFRYVESLRLLASMSGAFLGVRSFTTITPRIARNNNLPTTQGVWLSGTYWRSAVIGGTPADAAGLVNNDIIVRINDFELSESQSLTEVVRRFGAGEDATLSILRDGMPMTLNVTFGQR